MFTTIVCALSGVLWQDQPLRETVLQELLLRENIAPRRRHPWYQGGSDRDFLRQLWDSYGRSVSDSYLTQLVQRFHQQYTQALTRLSALPWHPDALAFLQQAQERGYRLGCQTECADIGILGDAAGWFHFYVADYRDLADPEHTLVVESTRNGLLQARASGAWVLGVARQMPYHWVQRYSHWAIDTLADWDWARIPPAPRAPAVSPAPAATDAETRTEPPR
ncbi:MAG: hypothetical protein RMI89_08030 [Gloeomargarita sp. SKYBB_i_bin120]|nr:hypothetical protein [Gloeomargarita sp. SKYG98]MCS7292907.1 hypothetical protein [Gloeomargarita sp. SKYB120]MDW8178470.1 hypothetical protein [Gloeomargarita sp. SKYBB_i_bin120]